MKLTMVLDEHCILSSAIWLQYGAIRWQILIKFVKFFLITIHQYSLVLYKAKPFSFYIFMCGKVRLNISPIKILVLGPEYMHVYIT